MRKTYLMVIYVLFTISSWNPVHATLIDLGNGVIHDVSHNLYWYQDLTYFINQDNFGAPAATILANLNADAGFTSDSWGTWHMASQSNMDALLSYSNEDITSSFIPSGGTGSQLTGYTYFYFGRYGDGEYDPTYGTYCHPIAQISKDVEPTNVIFGRSTSTAPNMRDSNPIFGYAVYSLWVVADANQVNPVPEPATMLLLVSGLLGFAGFRRKMRK